MRTKKMDLVGAIMAYEDGTLEADKTLELFAELIRKGTGMAIAGQYLRQTSETVNRTRLYSVGKGKILKSL